MEAELAGVVRYTHYSLMVFGHNRIPIVSWLRNEATSACRTRTKLENSSRISANIHR
jgi:bacterioferritin (cytochrome b1)